MNVPMLNSTVINTVSTMKIGNMNFNHLLYGTLPIASPPIKITEVGAIKFTIPDANSNPVTINAFDTPANPASGAIIGIDKVASPELDGMKNVKMKCIQ